MSGFGGTIDTLLVAVPIAAVVGLVLLWLFLPRVQSWMRRPRWLWISSGLVFVTVLGAASPVLITSIDLSRQRSAIMTRLAEANLNERNPVTVELLEQGSVTVGSRVYRSPQLRRAGEMMFDESTGRVQYQREMAELLLAPAMPQWAPPMIFDSLSVAALILAAAVLGGAAMALGLAPMLAAVMLAAAGAAALALLSQRTNVLVAIAGMVVLVTGYGVLSRLVLRSMGWSRPTIAVANIVMRESTRKWYTGAFIIVLLVVLPLVPLAIEAGDPLRYRVQTFLSWSLGAAIGLAGLLTLVLSCSTVALEIRDRQIWQTLTKPAHRLAYILGKWLGVVSVTFVMLAVSGISILLFVEYLRTQPAQNLMDEIAVRDEILVARLGARPEYQLPSREQVDAAVTDMISADPTIREDIARGVRRDSEVRRMLGDQVRTEALSKQRSVAPGRTETLVFRGLGRAQSLGDVMTLTFLFHIGASDPHTQHPVTFQFPDGQRLQRNFVPAQRHMVLVSTQYIDANGDLSIGIGNFGVREGELMPGMGTLMWDPDGLEVLYRVGGFEANFLRALLLEWTKLAFLAMLGVCCASVLSFPVALLFTATIYAIGSMTPFLSVAIEHYWVDPDQPLVARVFQWVILSVATASNWLLSGFGEVSGESLLVEGRLVSWRAVAKAIGILGVLWSGGVLLVGWAAFRRKELAIYSGQGG